MIILTLFWTNQEAEASLICHSMICLEEKHTCNLSPPLCCWHILYSRTMGRRKDERQMLHLSLGHSLVKQWSLQSPGLSNILGTNGIISSQVLCLTLPLDKTSLRGSSFDSLVRCYTGSLWGSTEGLLGSKGRERKNNIHTFPLLFFSNICILLYFLVLTVPFISLPRWIFPFTTLWHEFNLLASKAETKLTAQNSKDYLGVPGTVKNILFQNSPISEILSPP